MSQKLDSMPWGLYSDDDIASFVDYLHDTLIPDLMESGHEATAEDFEESIKIIEQLQEQRNARPPAVTD